MKTNMHSEAILDTQSREKSLCYHIRVTLFTVPDELPSMSMHWACNHLATNPNPSLCLQTLSQNHGLHAHQDVVSGATPEKSACHPQENCPSELAKPSRLGETCQAPVPPQYWRPLWTQTFSLKHPEYLHPGRQPSQWF